MSQYNEIELEFCRLRLQQLKNKEDAAERITECRNMIQGIRKVLLQWLEKEELENVNVQCTDKKICLKKHKQNNTASITSSILEEGYHDTMRDSVAIEETMRLCGMTRKQAISSQWLKHIRERVVTKSFFADVTVMSDDSSSPGDGTSSTHPEDGEDREVPQNIVELVEDLVTYKEEHDSLTDSIKTKNNPLQTRLNELQSLIINQNNTHKRSVPVSVEDTVTIQVKSSKTKPKVGIKASKNIMSGVLDLMEARNINVTMALESVWGDIVNTSPRKYIYIGH